MKGLTLNKGGKRATVSALSEQRKEMSGEKGKEGEVAWRGVACDQSMVLAITMARENAHYGVDRLEKLGPGGLKVHNH